MTNQYQSEVNKLKILKYVSIYAVKNVNFFYEYLKICNKIMQTLGILVYNSCYISLYNIKKMYYNNINNIKFRKPCQETFILIKKKLLLLNI